MVYMSRPNQKNFTLPPALKAKWEEFYPKGSAENSRNGAGALFLYMLMPRVVRDAACSAAAHPDIEEARNAFWSEFEVMVDDLNRAKALCGAARFGEEVIDKKKGGKKPKAG